MDSTKALNTAAFESARRGYELGMAHSHQDCLRAAIVAYLTTLSEQGEAAQPAADWRTMDSAPKDGRRIELWHETDLVSVGGYPVHGSWRDYHPGQWSWRSDSAMLINATAWRPSAASPGIASQAEEGSGNDGV